MQIQTELLTFNEAKSYLRVNKNTLTKLIHHNQLPAFRVGKQWRIDKDELVNWLHQQQVNIKNEPEMAEVNT